MTRQLCKSHLQDKALVREKKVGKQFQYDMPTDLLMTFLAEVIIVCDHMMSWLLSNKCRGEQPLIVSPANACLVCL